MSPCSLGMRHQSPKQKHLNSLPHRPVFWCLKRLLEIPKFWSCFRPLSSPPRPRTGREEGIDKVPSGLIYLYFVLAPDIWKGLEELPHVCYFWFALWDASLNHRILKKQTCYFPLQRDKVRNYSLKCQGGRPSAPELGRAQMHPHPTRHYQWIPALLPVKPRNGPQPGQLQLFDQSECNRVPSLL